MLEDQEAFARALEALRAQDAEVIDRLLHAGGGCPPLRRRAPGLEGLAWIIVSQQLSTASAAAIFGRLQAQLGAVNASSLASAGDDILRACGLSAPKIRTLRVLAAAVAEGALDFAALAALPAEAAHALLVALKGVGPWTADIFLLFCLGHPDAWPAGDLALQEAARLVLDLPTRPSEKALRAIGERWRPWRGVAAHLLWAAYNPLRAEAAAAAAPPPA